MGVEKIFFCEGGWSFTGVLGMFHEKGGFTKEFKGGWLWPWNKLSWYVRLKLTQKGWHHKIHKTEIKQIKK